LMRSGRSKTQTVAGPWVCAGDEAVTEGSDNVAGGAGRYFALVCFRLRSSGL
jgi:hypothetical protein